MKPPLKQCTSVKLTIAFHLQVLQCPINTVSLSLYSLHFFQASAALSVFLFLSPQHHLLSQGTMCKAWPRVKSVAFPCFSLVSKPVELFSSFKSLCSSYLSLCIASIAIHNMQCTESVTACNTRQQENCKHIFPTMA